ncbi:unnamed protein product [Tuber melanosporum]|uniref:(Perigord truffle) hypothetical protein n=1 Tax=Tuber melanosporum (strain Mel28) TaxID=656061 RepID=D5GEL0_TUBMM|nr:uncharacterized protein GSTUM_00006544001 [Tuber melanosporum]CAZ82953.1 unnamed protein product [Tuber melanosporum]
MCRREEGRRKQSRKGEKRRRRRNPRSATVMIRHPCRHAPVSNEMRLREDQRECSYSVSFQTNGSTKTIWVDAWGQTNQNCVLIEEGREEGD